MNASEPNDLHTLANKEYVPIGENIARVRAELKWPQGRLAAYMRAQGSTAWKQNTVSRVENGKQSPDLQEIGHLVHALGPGVLAGTIEEMLLQQSGGWFKSKATERAIHDLYNLAGQLEDKIRELQSRLMAGDIDER